MESPITHFDFYEPTSDPIEYLERSSPTRPLNYYFVTPPNYESDYKTLPSSHNTTMTSTEGSPLTSKPIVNGHSNVATDIPESSPEVAATLVFFDLETTGLPRINGPTNTQITEISFLAVARDDFAKTEVHDLREVRIKNKLSLCVKPRCSVDVKAGQITGLDNAKLDLQHSFDESTAQMLTNFLMHLPQPVCLLAHNGIDFDFPLLKSELHRVGCSLPSNILVADTLLAVRSFDIYGSATDKNGKKKKPQYRNHKPNSLENLFRHYFKKKPLNNHSSEGDCLALMMVCHKLKEQILPWIDDNQCLFKTISPMW